MQHSTASSIGSLSTQNLTLLNPFACVFLSILSSHDEDGADSFECCVSEQGQENISVFPRNGFNSGGSYYLLTVLSLSITVSKLAVTGLSP